MERLEFTSDDPEHEQVWTFQQGGKRDLVIVIPRLVQLREMQPQHWQTIDIPLTAEAATTVFGRGGLSAETLRDMHPERLGEPGIGVFMDDGSFLLVDGNHRFFRRYTDGYASMTVHAASAPHWHPATVDVDATKKWLRRKGSKQ